MSIENTRSVIKRSTGQGSILYFLSLFLMLTACSGQGEDLIDQDIAESPELARVPMDPPDL